MVLALPRFSARVTPFSVVQWHPATEESADSEQNRNFTRRSEYTYGQ
jgi:hypothetical protein